MFCKQYLTIDTLCRFIFQTHSFCSTRDPNGPSLAAWPPYDNQKEIYLEINSNQLTKVKYNEDRMKFWLKDIPHLEKSAPTGTITISTKLGLITGNINYPDSNYPKKVFTFYNIPFAKPPVGVLRFAKPIPYGRWTGNRNATVLGNQCMQPTDSLLQIPGVETSEDCLILNIYVPNNISTSTKKPVMVWIHGGGFTTGSTHIYDSRHLALHGNVIVVTIQYRLGIFGFFSLGTTEALGNYGLWDQMLALEWVHQNIDSFGGDPTSVTIFGESAGGASVSLLSLIPRNKNRFHRVIAQSGTTSPWTMTNNTEASYEIGERVGCSKSQDPLAFMNCLRNSDANTLLKHFTEYIYKGLSEFVYVVEFGPVIDGELINKAPSILLKNFSSEEYKFFSSLDFMAGTMKSDGIVQVYAMFEPIQKRFGFNVTAGIASEEFCNILVPSLVNVFFQNNSLASRKICDEYQVKNNVSEQSRQIVDMYTEFFYAYPAYESLHSHSQDNVYANTFQFVFEFDGKSLLFPSPPSWYIGPGHGDDVNYFFHVFPFSEKERKLSSDVMTYWTNFAKYGYVILIKMIKE
jgi:carboxylesterase type B